MSETVKTTYDKSTKHVNVVVYDNNLSEDGASYAKVTRNTATADNLIADIAESATNRFEQPYLMYAASLFKTAILAKLAAGEAVNLFDLGVLYLTARGGITSESPTTSDIPTLSVGFTPSTTTKEAVADVEISAVQKSDSSPSIASVMDYTTGSTDGTLTAGCAVSVYGQRLKVAGDGSGVWFSPVGEDGSYDETAEGIEVTLLVKNMPSELSFQLPDGVTTGSYYIVVKTAATNGSYVCKTLKTGVSSFTVTMG